MWVYYRAALLVFGLLLVNLDVAVRQGEFAAPITVALEGLRGEDCTGAHLFALYVGGAHEEVMPARPGFWECPRRCVAEIALRLQESARIGDGAVRINIGTQEFTLPLSHLEARAGAYWLPANVRGDGDAPAFVPCRNWPGAEVFVIHYLRQAAPGLATLLVLGLVVAWGRRGFWRAGDVSPPSQDPVTAHALTRGTNVPRSPSRRERFMAIVGWADMTPVGLPSTFWNLAGWCLLIGGFIALECMQPYYFTQDDALVGELPGILLGCRSLWDGTFPDWNPYVFMGAPLATIGFWALTYPPQLLAYAIARHVLGDEFATMEVFAALHLLAGFIAMRHLCRRVGMGAMVANLAALSFVYAGCILIMGRSWHAFVANAVWLPLLGIAIQRFREGPVGWKWITGVGVVFGLAYHAGFPQVVAILGMFFIIGLVTVAACERMPLRRLAAAVPALLLGVGLAMPLLLHHLGMTGGHERFVPAENGIYNELPAALLPYPGVEAALPTGWGSLHVETMGHFYFFGGLFAALFALQAFAFWVFLPDRRAWARCWWVAGGIFALLMVLGEPAYLWKGVAALPMSKFFLRYTFRFYPWLAFSAILGGGFMLERLLATLRRRQPWELLVGAGMACVLAYHLAMCQPSFYSYGFRPYPDLPQEFEAVFHPYADKQQIGPDNSRRIASWTNFRSIAPDHYLALPLNLPHYYQVPSIFGYDPVVEGQPAMAEVYRRLQNDPVAACRAYGVGWHLFGYRNDPELSPNRRMWSMEKAVNLEPVYRHLLKADLKPLAEHHGTSLMELPGAAPLAFVTGQPERPLPLRLHCRGADIDVAGLPAGTSVTVNFLWYPHMTCTQDGKRLPVDKDDWQRVTTVTADSGTTLSLRFEPPWLRTCGVGAAVCAAALALVWLALRRR